jgi:2-oxoisovalerate dehydrogenase E1 component
MHVYAMHHGLLGTSGVVGGSVPLAVGSALTMKTLGKPNVSVAFYGDGASNHGLSYESMNLAAVYKLPVVFVCENNLYATATPLVDVAANPEIASRADAFRMPGVAVDGNDVLAVYEAAGDAIDRAKAGGGPTLIEAKTYRTCGHYEGDQIAGTYRTMEEIEEWKKRCPISTYRIRLSKEYGIGEDELSKIEAKIDEEIDRAVEFARQSPRPVPETVQDHIFAEAG